MYVFDGTGGVKKENKVWGQKHKQLDATPEKKIVSSLALINLMLSKQEHKVAMLMRSIVGPLGPNR
jgi:hypothetical protein